MGVSPGAQGPLGRPAGWHPPPSRGASPGTQGPLGRPAGKQPPSSRGLSPATHVITSPSVPASCTVFVGSSPPPPHPTIIDKASAITARFCDLSIEPGYQPCSSAA